MSTRVGTRVGTVVGLRVGSPQESSEPELGYETGLVLRYRGDSHFESSGVQVVYDLSPSLLDGQQPTQSRRPSAIASHAAFGGRPVFGLAGNTTRQGWDVTWPSGLTSAEVFCVMRCSTAAPSSPGNGTPWNITTAGHVTHVPFTDGNVYDGTLRSLRIDGITGFGAANVAYIYGVSSAAGAWSCRKNGVQLHATASSVFASPASAILGSSAGYVTGWDGEIAEFLVFNHVLSAGNRAAVHTYLRDYYALGGVTL